MQMNAQIEEIIENNFTVPRKRTTEYPGILHMKWNLFSRHLQDSPCDENRFFRCKETWAEIKISATQKMKTENRGPVYITLEVLKVTGWFEII